jgi:formyl-CoA transferase
MVLAALVEREQSAVGQYLEVPQTGAGLFAMSDVHGFEKSKSETFPLDRDQRGHAPTNGLYRTADGWIVIACYSDREWDGVRRALGITAEWPDFATARNQRIDQSGVTGLIEAAVGRLSTSSVLRRLHAENVPCAPPAPFASAEVTTEPSMVSRGVIVTENHYDAGEVSEVGHTVRFGNANTWNLRPAPVTGQHSVAILREIGRSDADIARLIEGKVVNAPKGRDVEAAKTGRMQA